MMSKVWFAPHRKSPYPLLALSIYGQTPVSRTLYVSACSHQKPVFGPQLPAAVVPTATYGELHPWFLKGTSLSVQSECLCHGCTQ